MSTNLQFPCSICDKQVRDSVDAIFCDFCKLWVHRLSKSDFQTLVQSSDSEIWSCLKCNCNLFPFNPLSPSKVNLNCHHLPSSSSHSFSKFFNDMNSAYDDIDDYRDCEESHDNLDCKYYDISEFNSLTSSSNFFSFLHLNISSMSKHFDNFTTFLGSLQHQFNIIAVTESRILKSSSYPNFDLDGVKLYQLLI